MFFTREKTIRLIRIENDVFSRVRKMTRSIKATEVSDLRAKIPDFQKALAAYSALALRIASRTFNEERP